MIDGSGERRFRTGRVKVQVKVEVRIMLHVPCRGERRLQCQLHEGHPSSPNVDVLHLWTARYTAYRLRMRKESITEHHVSKLKSEMYVLSEN